MQRLTTKQKGKLKQHCSDYLSLLTIQTLIKIVKVASYNIATLFFLILDGGLQGTTNLNMLNVDVYIIHCWLF